MPSSKELECEISKKWKARKQMTNLEVMLRKLRKESGERIRQLEQTVQELEKKISELQKEIEDE